MNNDLGLQGITLRDPASDEFHPVRAVLQEIFRGVRTLLASAKLRLFT
jgi:hypothetical protein